MKRFGLLGKLFRSYSFFHIILLTYISLLLFSISFNVFNFFCYAAELKEQKRLYDQVMFQQIDTMLNGKLDRVDSLLTNILTDVKILRAISVDDLIASTQLSQTLQAAMQMRNHNNRTQTERLYIYFSNSDAIIMDGSYYRPPDFYRFFIDPDQISYAEWYVKLNRNHVRAYERAATVGADEMVMYHSVPGGTEGRDALIAIQFGVRDVFNVFRDSFFSGQMRFYVFDRDGEPLVSYGSPDYSGEENRKIEPFTSSRTGWTYVSVIPAEIYDNPMNEMLRRTGCVLGLELVAGTLLCVAFAHKNSVPLTQLSRRLSGAVLPKGRRTNEFGMINSCFDRLIAEKAYLLRKHEQVIRNNLLISFLNGAVFHEELEDGWLARLGLCFEAKKFQVVNIQIRHGDGQSGKNGLENLSRTKYAAMCLLGDAFRDMRGFYLADVGWDRLGIILNEDNLDQERICRLLDDVINALTTDFGDRLSIGIGGIYPSMNDIRRSNLEGNAALEYIMFGGKETVCAYRDITSRDTIYYPSFDKEKAHIKALVRLGDADGAIGALNGIFMALSEKQITLEAAKCVFFDIMGIGFEVLSGTKFAEQAPQADYLAALFDCKTIDRLRETLIAVFADICARAHQSRNTHNQRTMDAIHDYIEAHCFDNEFSLVSLADHVGLTPPYLSGLFKERTGQNLMDHLTERRMTKARALLSGTKMNVADVAVSVGYISSSSFIRSFKNVEGLTPAQYRLNELRHRLP